VVLVLFCYFIMNPNIYNKRLMLLKIIPTLAMAVSIEGMDACSRIYLMMK